MLTFEVIFQNKFFPRTYLGDTNLTYLTRGQALKILGEKFNHRATDKLTLSYNNQIYQIDLPTISPQLNFQKEVDQVFRIGRSGVTLEIFKQQLETLAYGRQIIPQIELSSSPQINKIAKEIRKEPQQTIISLAEDEVKITPGVDGLELDQNQLNQLIKNYLIWGIKEENLPVKKIPPDLSLTKATQLKTLLKSSQKEPINLVFEEKAWLLDHKTMFNLLDLSAGPDLINSEKLTNYLKKVATEVDQPVVEALFNFDPQTKRVTAFKPAERGQELDQKKTALLINLAIKDERPRNITLPVSLTYPKIQTSEVNDLGINELIGQGVSYFAGSIPNRIYNVRLTASKLNGVLVPPGQIFSFNSTVGDITAATGFKQAYVIKEGRTILDDGGGVCQDSTTLFRAVLNAGLPIIKRTAHAYRVGYYEQGFPPGLDATVFYPTVDFQFKNDTPAHILIQAYTSGLTLYVDLYGTNDGRVTTLSKPTITDQIPPPEDLRQDDPTLPKGIVKQVDWSAWGAKVAFKRTVVRDGKVIINETWNSHYKPWQAIYLVGTQ